MINSDTPRCDEQEVATIPTSSDYYELLKFARGLEQDLARAKRSGEHLAGLMTSIKSDLDTAWQNYGKLVAIYARDMNDGLITRSSLPNMKGGEGA